MTNDFDNDQIDIGHELRELRSEAPEELISRVVSHVRPERSRPRFASRAGRRTALVFAMTVALVGTAGAFGAVSQAARGLEGAVSAVVHIGHASHHARTTHPSHPNRNGIVKPGSQPPPSHPSFPGGPSGDQYNPGCSAGGRGKYVICRMP